VDVIPPDPHAFDEQGRLKDAATLAADRATTEKVRAYWSGDDQYTPGFGTHVVAPPKGDGATTRWISKDRYGPRAQQLYYIPSFDHFKKILIEFRWEAAREKRRAGTRDADVVELEYLECILEVLRPEPSPAGGGVEESKGDADDAESVSSSDEIAFPTSAEELENGLPDAIRALLGRHRIFDTLGRDSDSDRLYLQRVEQGESARWD
jgi:hypothetical protein